MKKYTIEITETLQKQIEITANSEGEAIRIAKEKYKNEDIILCAKDYVDITIKVIRQEKTRNEYER